MNPLKPELPVKIIAYSNIFDLLSPYIANLLDNKPRWHKSFYATFTNKVNLHSIQYRSAKDENTDSLRPFTSSKVASGSISGCERCILSGY